VDASPSGKRWETGPIDDRWGREIALSEMKLDGGELAFKFYINEKPYEFAGKVGGAKLEGKYSGEEANGKLQCAESEK
jgi:hypothetical protein